MPIGYRILLNITMTLIMAMLFSNCTGQLKSKIDESASGQKTQENTGTNTPAADTPNSSSCAVSVSATSVNQLEPISLNVLSAGNISKIEFSVNNAAYSDLGLTRGSYSWPAGYFPTGNYVLRFRALTATSSFINCTPTTQTVNVYHLSISNPTPNPQPTPSPTPSPSPAPQPSPSPGNNSSSNYTIDRSYVALIGYTANGSAFDAGFKNFKTIYHPDNMTLMDVAADFAPGVKCYNMQVRHHATSLRAASSTQKYRIYVPPGTKYFDMMTLTYWDQTTKQALAIKMNSAPQATYSEALNSPNLPGDSMQMSRILENMFNGQEYRSYITEGGNALPRISGGTTYGGATPYLYQTPRGGWIYVNQVKLIGDVAMNLEIRLCVDPTTYKNWYNSAQWDSDGNPL